MMVIAALIERCKTGVITFHVAMMSFPVVFLLLHNYCRGFSRGLAMHSMAAQMLGVECN